MRENGFYAAVIRSLRIRSMTPSQLIPKAQPAIPIPVTVRPQHAALPNKPE